MVVEVIPVGIVMGARAPQNQPRVAVLGLCNSVSECAHLPSEACGISPVCCFPTGNIALQTRKMCPSDRPLSDWHIQSSIYPAVITSDIILLASPG